MKKKQNSMKNNKNLIKDISKKLVATGNIHNVYASRKQPPAAKSPDFVQSAIYNPYLREQIINLMPQIFSGRPDITVCKIGEVEPDDELTAKFNQMFNDVDAYQSMRISFLDTLFYGASVKSIGYDRDGSYIYLSEIRDLPATTFSSHIYRGYKRRIFSPNPLMPGIGIDANGEIIVVQTDPTTLAQNPLENVIIIKQPDTPYPAGEAFCLPIYSIIREIDIVTEALNRKVNRVATPIVMARITEDVVGDLSKLNEWAEGFFKRWASGTSAGELLPEGIELVDVKIYESQGGEERLKCLTDVIAKYFNPTKTLDKEGDSITSTDSGKTAIWHAYITSLQEWIESEYEAFFNNVLFLNGYNDYEVKIQLPRPSVDQSQLKFQQLQLALQNNLVTKSEARYLLDTLDLPPLTPEIEQDLIKNNNNFNSFNAFTNVNNDKDKYLDSNLYDIDPNLIDFDSDISKIIKDIQLEDGLTSLNIPKPMKISNENIELSIEKEEGDLIKLYTKYLKGIIKSICKSIGKGIKFSLEKNILHITLKSILKSGFDGISSNIEATILTTWINELVKLPDVNHPITINDIKEDIQNKLEHITYWKPPEIEYLNNKLLEIVSECVKNHDTNAVITQKLMTEMGLDEWQAERIARTETMRAVNSARVKRIETLGADYVEFVAGENDRTCEDCMQYHGQIFRIGEEPQLPLHPNCRCTYVAAYPNKKDDENE